MRNVFLDLGTHYGQGLREFIGRFGMNDTWVIHTFEANPTTHGIFLAEHLNKTPWVISHNKAITNFDGTITLNVETPLGEGDTGQGSSLIGLDSWDPWGLQDRGNFKKQVDVPCIDFSKFILDNFSKDDNIVVKMDIEGSEFDTLDKMISDGSIEYLNYLTVEWHSRFFINDENIHKREDDLIKTLSGYKFELETWK